MSKYCFKEYINSLWKESGLSQGDFADKLGVGYSTIKDALRGKTSIPQPSFLKALSKYTGLSELKVLQNVFYFEFSEDIKNNQDTDAMTLYSCYLYQNNWSFINTKLFEQAKPYFDKDLDGTITECFDFNIILKKSNYPKRAMFLSEGIGGPVDKDFGFYIWQDLDAILDNNHYYQNKFTSYDCSFVYNNSKKNLSLFNEIKKQKIIKPQGCNSISFIVFDNKSDKIIDKFTC